MRDDIDGLGGDDLILGMRFKDSLVGGLGDDVIYGGAGGDAIGSPFTDDAEDGQDVWHGGFGADFNYAFDGDSAFGGGQNDVLPGGGRVVLNGGPGADELGTFSGPFSPRTRVRGGRGDDTFELHMRSGVPFLLTGTAFGGGGDDNRFVERANRVLGGAGNDDIRLTHEFAFDDEIPAGAADLLSGGAGDDLLNSWPGSLVEPVACGPVLIRSSSTPGSRGSRIVGFIGPSSRVMKTAIVRTASLMT